MAEADDGRGAGVLRFLPAALSAAAAWWFFSLLPAVGAGPLEWSRAWVPSFGFTFSFRLDGLAMVFALLVTGVGALILLYAAEYFRSHRQRNQLLLLLVLFEISMLGLVTADDALTLFLFWEGTTVTSFLLIGFDHEKADARAKAIQALVVTGLGGVALLGGLLLLGAEAGTYRLSEMAAQSGALADSALYLPIFLLVILGCFTKSAQIPFHFWLPNAMAAPTPVSAYLHSATMVKAGVYLLARLSPALGGTELWMYTLTIVGAATMLLSSLWSMRQNDLKLALAYTTVMGLGALVMLLGMGGEGATIAFAVFLIVHALYKASLFLVIGILDKCAGSRMAEALGGLGRALPFTFAVALAAGASMAGLPPFFGFIGKETIYESALHAEVLGWFVILCAVLANAMMFAIGGAVGLTPFIGDRRAPKAEVKGAPVAMWVGPALLAGLGLAFGAEGHLVDASLVGPIASAVAGHEVEVHLYLWHGVKLPLILSLATFALGILLFLKLPVVRAALARAESEGAPDPKALAEAARRLRKPGDARPAEIVAAAPRRRIPSFEGGYDAALVGIDRLAAGVAGFVQSGVMTRYLRATMAVFAIMVALGIVLGGRAPTVEVTQPPWLFLVAALLIAIGSAILPFTGNRLLMLTASGVVGVGVAIIFAIFGAIDVAITQLMIETLVVVIFAVALLKLPRVRLRREVEAVRGRRWAAVIASALGVVVAAALAIVVEGPLDLAVSNYYEKASATLAYGRNIVNVILVDFRALDTMGEIAVVAVAGLSALALLAAKVRPLEDRDE